MSAVDNAIADAVKAEETKESKIEETSEKEESSESEKPKAPGDNLTDEERVHAANLFAMLKDPATAQDVVSIMARQHGLIKTEKQAEKAAEEIAESIEDIFKKELGDDYQFLAPSISRAVEKAVSKEIDSKLADLRERAKKDDETKVANEVDKGIDILLEQYEDAETHLDAIYKLMDTHLPDPKASASDYLDDLYHIAKGRASKANASKTKQERITRAQADVPSRLASERKGSGDPTRVSATKMSLDESIAAAMKNIKD